MQKMVIRVKPEDLRLRNEMHFEVQRSTRMNIFNIKKAFYRPRWKAETRKMIREAY